LSFFSFFHIYEIRSLTRSDDPGLTRICLCFHYNEKEKRFSLPLTRENYFLFLGVKRRPTVKTQRKTSRRGG